MGFKDTVTNALGAGIMKVKAVSPEICLVGGLLCMAGAVMTGIMAAKKHNAIVEDHNKRLEEAKVEYVFPEEAIDHETGEIKEGATAVQRTEKEINRSVRREYFRTFAKFIRLYGRTAFLMALSAGFFISMHNIQAGRIAGLSGAYTGLKEYISAYEKRNIELNGEESHNMCKYGYKEVEVEEEDPDNGEKYMVKKKVPLEKEELKEMTDVAAPPSIIVWDSTTSSTWTGIANTDHRTLLTAQQILTNTYYSRGFVTRQDLLELLKISVRDEHPEDLFMGCVRGVTDEPDLGFMTKANNRFLAGYNGEDIWLEHNFNTNVYTALLKKKADREELEKRLYDSRKKEG